MHFEFFGSWFIIFVDGGLLRLFFWLRPEAANDSFVIILRLSLLYLCYSSIGHYLFYETRLV